MDMLELIKSRRSIRTFEKTMPEKELIMKCIEAATWAPSATNQQPWEFIVLAGEKLDKVNACIEQHFFERMQGSGFDNLPEDCEKRKDEIMKTISQAAEQDGINPAQFFEKEAGLYLSDGNYFGAPGHVRFNYGCPHSRMLEGLEKMAQALLALA